MGKQKFTQKRRPYKKYNLADWNWNDIFLEIDALALKMKQGYIKITSEKYGILYRTLCDKYNKYINDRKINNKFNNYEDNRGGGNKIFTDTEEDEIFNTLKNKFIEKQLAFCNEDIKVVAIEKYKNLRNNNKFTASNGWCNGFKKRWNLITVKAKISKTATKIHSNDDLNLFINECQQNYKLVGPSFFLI
jgi:hypothetical protein